MSKKKTIEANGRVEDTGTQYVPTTLDEIWAGHNPLSKFSTTDAKVYQSRLDEMNRADLETESRRLGLMIVESTARLRDNCMRHFNEYFLSLRTPVHQSKPVQLTEEARKILAEGR